MAASPDVSSADDLIENAVDVHVHSSPDLIEWHAPDVELARSARAAGMRRLVIKSHVVSTVGRVDLVNEAVGEKMLYGGIALNGSVGGVNPAAVKVALDLGAKIVWLPTAWSANHAWQARAAGIERFVGQRVPTPEEQLETVIDGDLTEATTRVIELVANRDAVLGTGHLAPRKIETVVSACETMGARCLVNHPFFRVVDMPIETQERLAEKGAVMEYCAYSIQSTDGHRIARVAEAIDRVGPERCLLATDFGQQSNPPIEGLTAFARELMTVGLARDIVRRALVASPEDLLSL